MKNSINSRMKEKYEIVTRYQLPRRTYTIIRVDGRAFHTFTKKFERPFDMRLIEVMKNVAINLCEQIDGAKLAYAQSDEISILCTDFDSIYTEPWFGGILQKVCSVSASIATMSFTMHFEKIFGYQKPAHFDSRVSSIPDPTEVENYVLARQQDCTRNSIQMAATTLYSPKELHKKNTSEQQDMLHAKGINWNDYPTCCKRGTTIVKRNGWEAVETPIFTQDRTFLRSVIPLHPSWRDDDRLS